MQTAHSNEKPDYLQPVMQAIAHSPLQKLVQKAKFLLALDQHLKTILPADFAPNCQVMNVNQQTLIVGVKSAAMIARLQFLSRDILQAVRRSEAYAGINQIKFCVQPITPSALASSTKNSPALA